MGTYISVLFLSLFPEFPEADGVTHSGPPHLNEDDLHRPEALMAGGSGSNGAVN